ncbi:replication restart helicase PriA [Cephaloticoccus primus]|uniref:replication restart helicase PriA n=1 Tax=Cephaloticoccus primus TaxID=1548207 RepID=UPI0009ED40D8|nr:primosomal protein N' [Cephaloticoccus primus]
MIVGVHPLAGFDKLLHYRVPERLCGSVGVGSLVRVPVLNALRLGVVGEVGAPKNFPVAKLKSLAELVYPFPALTPELLRLAQWMARYYAASLDSIIETMIPVAVRNGAAIKEEVLLRALPMPAVCGEGSQSRAAGGGRALGPQQARVYAFLEGQAHPQPKGAVLQRLGVSASVVAGLIKRGLVREERRRVVRHAYADDWASGEVAAAQPPALNAEQAAAASAIEARLDGGGFGVSLLHGVTGSGKTEVYLHAIDRALKAGGGVIFLVPEVALTPQTVARLRARLEAIAPGHACIVWHSHLSEGERLDGWLALASGEARVVVGARSAVFAPVQNLRLIVVDEEHEPAYKQDESPRYHGRDVAVYRAHLARAHCVLGSATPSLESYANVQAGKYALLELKQRVDDRRLPFIDVVDMRVEMMRSRGAAILSQRLVHAMQDRFEKREQVILFINRRGYSSSMICQDCGHVEECEHCSIAMTYHRTDETLRCHLCGAQRPAPVRCPKCGSPKIRWRGLGTQRVEEAVRRVLPRARIERMDTDTMGRKNRFREVLGDFRAGKIDVLVGTQMIAKGLDFPNVTLVGLVDADISLHIPDFRASERTFQLLVQVAGRAGRGDLAGEVIVQTFTPQAEPIQFSRHADFAGFSEAELKLRRDFKYPPYRHLIKHLFRGPNPEKLAFYAEQWARKVEAELGMKSGGNERQGGEGREPAAVIASGEGSENGSIECGPDAAAAARGQSSAGEPNVAPTASERGSATGQGGAEGAANPRGQSGVDGGGGSESRNGSEGQSGRVELRGPSPSPIEKVKDHYRWQLWYFTENVSKTVPKLVALQQAFPWPSDIIQVLDVDPVSLG